MGAYCPRCDRWAVPDLARIGARFPTSALLCMVITVRFRFRQAIAMRRNGLLVCVAWLIAFSGFPSAHAATPDWRLVREADGFSLWVDAASLQKEGNVVKVWTKLEFKTAEPIYQGSAKMKRSDRRHDYVDCLARTSALKSAASFSEPNLRGVQVAGYRSDASKTEWKQVKPNTVAETILEFACARASAQ